MTKVCNKCNVEKESYEFYVDKSKKGGLAHQCKNCKKEIIYATRHKNILRVREIDRKSRERRKEKIMVYNKLKWEKNKVAYSQLNKIYREKNREKLNQYNRDYQQANKVELNKKALVRSKERRKHDLNYKIRMSIRARLQLALKGKCKSASTLELLGCDIPTLRNYLASKFIEDMTWENYGLKGWHIDHIVPCSSFDMSKPEQQRLCFNYSNLQPLWWFANLKKGATI